MSLFIKTPEEIEKMRVAGKLAAEVLEMVTPHVVAGITTDELNALCHTYITEVQDAIPAPLDYRGFPKSICTSVNHQVCHGIPGKKKLKDGDIINIDVTVIKDEYHGDTSKMFIIGKTSPLAERLVRVAQECLYLGIEMVKPGVDLRDIGAAIEQHAKKQRFSSVHEYCGHGIGRGFHEDPQVLHYDVRNSPFASEMSAVILEPGMTFTIEPMINAGKRHTKVLPDEWTVVTKDKSLSAQWEHTLLVTEGGVEILTRRSEESF